MSNVYIGMRVRVCTYFPDNAVHEKLYTDYSLRRFSECCNVGTVVLILDARSALVEFDDEIPHGHNGQSMAYKKCGRHFKPKSCWYVPQIFLVPISKYEILYE